MGDTNQLIYLKKHAPKVAGAIIEIGSKNYGNAARFRDWYSHNKYVGIDMAAGEGVDKILDLTESTGDLQKAHFDLGICCSVLEHVRKPWVMAENITSLIRPSGLLYVAVPWVWRYHAYPDDFFRFSWRGIEELFPAFHWRNKMFSTNLENEFFDIGNQPPWVDDQMAYFKWTIRGKRKHLPYLQVHMIGAKRAT
jgi:hypothetical protein